MMADHPTNRAEGDVERDDQVAPHPLASDPLDDQPVIGDDVGQQPPSLPVDPAIGSAAPTEAEGDSVPPTVAPIVEDLAPVEMTYEATHTSQVIASPPPLSTPAADEEHALAPQKRHRLSPLFLLTVVIPTLLAAVYYGLIASDVYVSESRFVVRSPDKPSASGLGVLLKSAGFSNAGDEIYAARDFVLSRDALALLNARGGIKAAYTRPDISIFDRFNPLGLDGSFERLYRYYLGKVAISEESTTSITTLTVRAYTPQEAQRINRELLELSEAVVNRLNTRGRNDLIDYARREAIEAEGAAREASARLASFRNRSGVIDPERQATVQLQMVSKLQDELIGSRTLLRQLLQIAPQNPQIPLLKTRIAELERQIERSSGQVAGDRSSLSANAAQYQRFQIDREIADKRLAAAMASLQEATNEARRKQAYVERIVQPNRPDSALEPKRLRGILSVLIVGLLLYGVAAMLLAGVREHQD